MWSSPGHFDDRKKSVLPQREQNPRSAPGDDLYQRSKPSSSTMRARSPLMPTHVTNAAPWIRRHIVQWQCATHLLGSSARNATPVQKQAPAAVLMIGA